jgi:hypothetical protein
VVFGKIGIDVSPHGGEALWVNDFFAEVAGGFGELEVAT